MEKTALVCGFLVVGILAVALLTGCARDEYFGMEPVPDLDNTEYWGGAGDEVRKNAADEPDLEGAENPDLEEAEGNPSLREGCFYEKNMASFTRAGIAYYYLEFRNEQGDIGHNFTSRSNVTLNKIMKSDIGVCVYQNRWQFFDRDGNLWTTVQVE